MAAIEGFGGGLDGGGQRRLCLRSDSVDLGQDRLSRIRLRRDLEGNVDALVSRAWSAGHKTQIAALGGGGVGGFEIFADSTRALADCTSILRHGRLLPVVGARSASAMILSSAAATTGSVLIRRTSRRQRTKSSNISGVPEVISIDAIPCRYFAGPVSTGSPLPSMPHSAHEPS